MIVFIQFILLCFLVLAFTLFIGLTISSFFSLNTLKNRNENIFLNLFIGLITIVFCVSVYKTNGITINILILLIVFLIIYLQKNKFVWPKLNQIKYKDFFKDLIYCTPFLLLFFIREFFYFTNNSASHFLIPHDDFIFYSELSSSIMDFGRENKGVVLNSLYPQLYNGVAPYHYFELWTTGFWASVFNISTLKTLLLITYPILSTAVYIAILAIFETFSKIKIQHYFIAITLLCISGVYFYFYEHFELTKYHIGFTQSGILAWGRKYLPLYLVTLFALNYYLKKEYLTALLILLLCAIFSIGSAPGIIFTILVTTLFLTIKNKNLIPILFTILFCIAVYLFYHFFTVKSVSDYLNNVVLYQRILHKPTDISLYKELLFSFIFPFARFIITYLPFIVLIILMSFRKGKIIEKRIIPLFLFSIILCVSAAFFAALYNGMLDSGQLFYNILPVFNCILIVSFIMLYQDAKKRIYIITIFPILFIFHLYNANSFFRKMTPPEYNSHSDNFTLKCLSELDKNEKKEIIAYSLNDANYSLGVLQSLYKTPCLFLTLTNKGAYFADINSFRQEQFVNKSDYSLGKTEMITFKKMQNQNYSNDELQIKFIEKYHIKYLYLQNNAVLSDYFYQHIAINKTMIDENTGDKFIVLN